MLRPPQMVRRLTYTPLLLLSLLSFLSLCSSDDRSTLLRIKSSLSSDHLPNWTGEDVCDWAGVSCSNRSRVTSLTLSSLGLSGSLSPSIGGLTELSSLVIISNSLAGEIPTEINALLNLQTLDLSHNSFNGSVPVCTSQSQKLPNLRELRLAFNYLSGSIPDSIGSNCPNLEILDLSGNFLVGSIPPTLAKCVKLRSLLISSNFLDDIIPVELGGLRNLQTLDVSVNSLSGAVPPELGGCTELSVLVLSNPYYINETSSQSSLNTEHEEYNYFQGGIPASVVKLPKLRVLWAPRATMEGPLPVDWGDCGDLEMVNLGENLFLGGIPNGLLNCTNLKFLNLSSNKLTGTVSRELPVPCMDLFDVSGNQLSGEIGTFDSGTCVSQKLPIDDSASAYYSYFINKAFDQFDFGSGFLSYHNFGRNNFTGGIPILPLAGSRLGKERIYAFLADGNNLAGPLGRGFLTNCNNSKGLIVNLSNNFFSGGMPVEIGTCTSLSVLELAGNQINGTILETICQLNNLVSLDLSRNFISGEIPSSISKLQTLKRLLLSHNFLTGSIPSDISTLKSLEVLDLSSNSLSGEIPGDLVNLHNLSTVLLNNNKLSGKIPNGFADLPALTNFNVSFNNLSGPLPANATTIGCSTVIGNPNLQSCHVYSFSNSQGQYWHSPDSNSTTNSANPTTQSNNGFSSIEIASITSATAIVSVLLALIVLFIYTRKCAPKRNEAASRRRRGRREVTVFSEIGVPITFESVVRATGSFNASNCIGSGGFGATYKAEISPGVLVAIKRLSVGRFNGLQQFHAEIKTLGRLRHPNLVTLIGYHLSESEMFLIYNYLPGGNLERFIQERPKRVADWRILHRIALDIARALAYLHDVCVPRILHRDVKPSNILLDNELNAYLSDFGLARLLGNSETHATTGVAGTFGYVAPEYAMTCRVSDKADVYSYGVVLMELISDKKALDPSFSPYGNGFNIVQWACMLLRQGRAKEFFIEGLWDVGPHDDMVEVLHLGVMCTVDSLSVRPTMKQVVQRLKQLQPPT